MAVTTSLRRPWLVAAVLSLGLTACGSTVQSTGQISTTGGVEAPGSRVQASEAALAGTTPASGSVGPVGAATALAPGSSGAQPPADVQTTGAQVPAPSGQGTGAARPRNHTPLSLGFLVSSDNQASKAIGADNAMSFTYRDAAEKLVAAMNAHGGLAGRKVVPVYFEVNTQGDFDTQLAAACASFTQDHHVAAVVDVLNAVIESFEACLNKAKVPHVNGSFSTADGTLLTQTPNLLAPNAPSLDRQITGVLQGLHDTGYITSTHKLGVIFEECPYVERPIARTLRPLAAKLGVAVTEAGVQCIRAFSDVGPAASALSNAVLAFRSAGVDRVTFVSTFEGTLLLLFSKAAEAQQYRPGYALSTQSLLSLIGSQLDAPQREGLRGMGWIPVMDTSPGKTPAAPASSARCLGLYGSQGLTPTSSTDRLLLLTECTALFVLESALTDTAGDSSSTALVGAVQRLHGSFSSTATLNGATRLEPGHRDGPTTLREMRWNTTCSCAQYTSDARLF